MKKKMFHQNHLNVAKGWFSQIRPGGDGGGPYCLTVFNDYVHESHKLQHSWHWCKHYYVHTVHSQETKQIINLAYLNSSLYDVIMCYTISIEKCIN